jgi:hypothetical protein
MRIRFLGLAMVIVFVLMGAQAWAESFRLPDLPDLLTEEVVTTDKKSGAFLWSSLDGFEKGKEKQKENGKEIEKTFVRYSQKGSGKYGGSKDPIKWEIEGYYYADPYIRPYYSKRSIFSEKGKLLEVQTLYFDTKDKKIYFTREDKVYSLTLHYKGTEKITVPAGTFECYKLEMTVDLGLLGIVSAFVPKTYFWYRAKDQQWIKYEGLESGLGTPYIVMQLAEEPVRTYLPRKKSEKK